jgi:hypothetical protein
VSDSLCHRFGDDDMIAVPWRNAAMAFISASSNDSLGLDY